MKINNIWQEMENEESFSSVLLIRRYSASYIPNVYIALTLPEKTRGIGALIDGKIEIDKTLYDNLKDITIEIRTDEKDTSKNLLLINLLTDEHRDIFSVLCEDLLTNIQPFTSDVDLTQTILNRFEKWKSLFSKIQSVGLSPNQQRGLFGELYFLRTLLQNNKNYQSVLTTWVGPAGEIRDFQMATWALEVKTTHGNNHQKIQISSERQLDNTHLDYLFLYHLSLEKVQKGGETLRQIIGSIFQTLSTDIISFNRFKSKLFEAGYFDHQVELYETHGYFIRQDVYYIVKDEFPRIQENEIKSGVGDVKYSIILSQCENYKITEKSVFETLTII